MVQNNLPHPRTPFFGRQTELTQLIDLLQNPSVSLVTLTGPGGTGKTRLSIQVGSQVLPQFRDGVCFVSLAPLTGEEQVIPAIAQALAMAESSQHSAVEDLLAFLSGKPSLLLILDNFEHVMGAAVQVADLLSACPGLKVLVTSREALRLYGERIFPVSPLALPEPAEIGSGRPETIAKAASVELFTECASAVRPDFKLDQENAVPVAEICVLLDGLPLAIELAAARLKLFSPKALLHRLWDDPSSGLKLLSGGARDLPERQQTLRATIAWSYHLLNPAEQAIFRRVAVFLGSFGVLAAEQVTETAATETESVLNLLESLVDKSLLRVSQSSTVEPRFSMLHVIREFALDQLAEQGELERAQQLHAAYYLALAEKSEQELEGKDQETWLAMLAEEHDNLRAVLRWAERTGQAETGLRMVGALIYFWLGHGHLMEGRAWSEKFINLPSPPDLQSARAKAYTTAGALALTRSDYETARRYFSDSLSIGRALGDQLGIAKSLNHLGLVAAAVDDTCTSYGFLEASLQIARELDDWYGIAILLHNLGSVAQNEGEYQKALGFYEESLSIRRRLGDMRGIANSLLSLAIVAFEEGDFAAARTMHEESLALQQKLGDRLGMAHNLWNLGRIHAALRDYRRARELLEESLAICSELGEGVGISDALHHLGTVSFLEGDLASALARYEESLSITKESGDKPSLALSLEAFARLAAAGGLAEPAAVLWGAAEGLREAFHIPLPPSENAINQTTRDKVQSSVPAGIWQARRAEGRAMPLEQSLTYVTQVARNLHQALEKKLPARTLSPLSNRETEVLRLVAQGLSDAQVAEQLVLSVRTVNTHLTSIYNKLGVNSRTAAARYAVENGLI